MRSSSEYITDPAHFSRRILARIYFQLSRLGGGGSLNLSTDEKPGTHDSGLKKVQTWKRVVHNLLGHAALVFNIFF
jgi:hypothetical protein